MTEEIEQLLRNLHLKKIAAIIDDELAHAEKHQFSYGAFLARLLRAQYHHRQETALAWRITQARLPEAWTIESFPFKRQPGVNPKQIRALADLEFVAKAENLVFIGQTGVGKTGLASGLLLKAIQNGYCRRPSPQLCITKHSALNLDYPEWQTFLGNKALVDALLSRLRHQCHTIRIDGPSLRDPQEGAPPAPPAPQGKGKRTPWPASRCLARRPPGLWTLTDLRKTPVMLEFTSGPWKALRASH